MGLVHQPQICACLSRTQRLSPCICPWQVGPARQLQLLHADLGGVDPAAAHNEQSGGGRRRDPHAISAPLQAAEAACLAPMWGPSLVWCCCCLQGGCTKALLSGARRQTQLPTPAAAAAATAAAAAPALDSFQGYPTGIVGFDNMHGPAAALLPCRPPCRYGLAGGGCQSQAGGAAGG